MNHERTPKQEIPEAIDKPVYADNRFLGREVGTFQLSNLTEQTLGNDRFTEIYIETKSGNQYAIYWDKNSKNFVLVNSRENEVKGKKLTGTILSETDINNAQLQIGKQFRYSSNGITTEITKITAINTNRIYDQEYLRKATNSVSNNSRKQFWDRIMAKQEESVEEITLHELDEKIRNSAHFLERLDAMADNIAIDSSSGAITIKDINLPKEIGENPTQQYEKTFRTSIKQFEGKNQQHLTLLKSDSAVLDAKIFMGAIVVTFDSSKKVPQLLGEETDCPRGWHKDAKINLDGTGFFGLVAVDLNLEKRKIDRVEPSVSATHELRHHARSINDYLLAKNNTLGMQTTFRNGRNQALFGNEQNNLPTDTWYFEDRKQYALLLEREFDAKIDPGNIKLQLSYLDELHSSFLQRKENWFHAASKVYSNRAEGKHWEIVGNSLDDQQATKRLLAYLQGMYLVDQYRQLLQQKVDQKLQIGESQKLFIENAPKTFLKVGSLIGTARTVKQAEHLIKEEWQNLVEKYPRLFEKDGWFDQTINNWETNYQSGQPPAGVENMRNVLLVIQ